MHGCLMWRRKIIERNRRAWWAVTAQNEAQLRDLAVSPSTRLRDRFLTIDHSVPRGVKSR